MLAAACNIVAIKPMKAAVIADQGHREDAELLHPKGAQPKMLVHRGS